MAIKRKAVDPFGMSLLDVLSNALGGVILLMLIVAATLKGNDKKRLNLPPEGEQGIIYTELDFEILDLDLDMEILIVQIQLSEPAKLTLDAPDNAFVSMSTNDNVNWLILQEKKAEEGWQVRFPYSSNRSPNTASIAVNLNGWPLCVSTIALSPGASTLLSVARGEGQPIINMAGKSCP
ncbi:MAG: hypothetical protein MI974_20885 [Chitinophagales bacterium]|nr:hypothetical protein [Chitinophagales bacterium]